MIEGRPHIVVIGNIAAGKTAAVRALGRELRAIVYEEQFELNPYLAPFYADPERWAGQSQLWFLAELARQHLEIGERRHAVVQEQSIYSVFAVMTEHLAARSAISEHDLDLVASYYSVLDRLLPWPDGVVYLRAPVEVLEARVAARGRNFELSIPRDYLESIASRLEAFVAGWRRSPVIEVDSDAIDFREVRGGVALADLVRGGLAASPAG